MSDWIDTHCHLDAPEFGAEIGAVRERAVRHGVRHCVIPAVEVANFDTVRALAHQFGDSYALGIHPLYVAQAGDAIWPRSTGADAPSRRPASGGGRRDRARLFRSGTQVRPLKERQERFYREQLKLARDHGLPVILHVRRSADALLRSLRELSAPGGWHGIAHAFNGSAQQAPAFIDLGFKLGFGGAVTYDRALQLRRLAAELPLEALVLETDAPDIPPHWLYVTAEQRAAGQSRRRNEPGELPQIGAVLAGLRGMSVEALALATSRNAVEALPKLAGLVAGFGVEF